MNLAILYKCSHHHSAQHSTIIRWQCWFALHDTMSGKSVRNGHKWTPKCEHSRITVSLYSLHFKVLYQIVIQLCTCECTSFICTNWKDLEAAFHFTFFFGLLRQLWLGDLAVCLSLSIVLNLTDFSVGFARFADTDGQLTNTKHTHRVWCQFTYKLIGSCAVETRTVFGWLWERMLIHSMPKFCESAKKGSEFHSAVTTLWTNFPRQTMNVLTWIWIYTFAQPLKICISEITLKI